MPGKKINTCEEFIKEALTLGYNSSDNWTEAEWNDQIQERFNSNRNIYNFRIREVTENSILGATDNYFGLIKMMNQLDRIIENETDPVKKTMAMSVRHVAYPKCKTIIENNTLESIKSFYDEIMRDNTVSEKASKDFLARVAISNAATSGSAANALKGVDPNTAHFNELPSGEQLVVLSTLIGSFMDNNSCFNDNGTVRRENQPMKEVLDEVNKCADNLMKNARGDLFSGFNTEDDTEKADLNALKSLYKNLNSEKKATYSADIAGFNNLASYAYMDITPNVDSLALNLDKSPVVTTTAESFIRKHTSNTLSFAEIEWGESNVDYMIEGLYTADELKELKRAGLDPAMGILIDGKPIDFDANKSHNMLQSAKAKCEIVSKALQGSKIDAAKFVPDGRGGYTSGKIVPVKTDFSMRTERRSIWTILKELFGFVFSVKDRVAKANNAKRDYQIDPEKSKVASVAKRNAESLQLKEISTHALELDNKLDIDFFGDVYPAEGSIDDKQEAILNGIKKDSQYTSADNTDISIINTVGRITSRVNLAIVYGLTKGHTVEEMMAETPAGRTLRKQVGKEFVEEFKVCSLEEFAKKHELDVKSPETRDVYNTFVLEKVQDVEKMCAKSCEALTNLPLEIPDPSNHADFIEKYGKISRQISFAKDIAQSYESLVSNRILPLENDDEEKKTEIKPLSYSEQKSKQVFKRTAALHNYTSSMLEPIVKIGFPINYFSDYVKSAEYADTSLIDGSSFKADMAAVSKSVLTYLKDRTSEMNTIGDLNNNKALCAEIYALGFTCQIGTPDKSEELFVKEANLYIPSEAPDFNPVYVQPQSKQISVFGDTIDYSDLHANAKKIADGFTKGIEKYDAIIGENEAKLSISERIEAIKAAQSAGLDIPEEEEKKADDKEKQAAPAEKQAAPKEKVSFTELAEEKPHITEKPKDAAHAVKTLEAGSLSK